jgi:hypothetical protein
LHNEDLFFNYKDLRNFTNIFPGGVVFCEPVKVVLWTTLPQFQLLKKK